MIDGSKHPFEENIALTKKVVDYAHEKGVVVEVGLAEDGSCVNMSLPMCNRHGLIAGASGTGKTVTMKCMAESFADAGVPVFLCDVKGDVSGICTPGVSTEGMENRIDRFGIRNQFQYRAYTTAFWDIYGEGGHPVNIAILGK